MNYILAIDTSTEHCNIALFLNTQLVESIEDKNSMTHSEKLTVYIKEIMENNELDFAQLKAIAVCKGPGSYTGLRIGVSVAKGLAFSLNIPIISVLSLDNIVNTYLIKNQVNKGDYIIPMIDARRDEVYMNEYNYLGESESNTTAQIIVNESFDRFNNSIIHLIGNGSEKCHRLINNHTNFKIDSTIKSLIKNSGNIIFTKYQNECFEDLIYFEPYYLKKFVSTQKINT